MSDLEKDLGLGDEEMSGKKSLAAAEHTTEERECAFITLDKDDFPETWPQKADVEVVIVNLSGDEELDLSRAAQGNQGVFLIEGAKRALVMWGGQKIDKGPALDEALWEKMGSRCRNLIAGQFARLWGGSEEGSKKAKGSFRRAKIRI